MYGLGSENQNLPAYVVLDDPKGLPINHIQNWHWKKRGQPLSRASTILHQLGLDHREQVMIREGRSERLTDEFPARVVKEILA